jgi:hypothetical protein
VTLRACWVTLRARWVTLRARWVTLRARWVTLRARWVTFRCRRCRRAEPRPCAPPLARAAAARCRGTWTRAPSPHATRTRKGLRPPALPVRSRPGVGTHPRKHCAPEGSDAGPLWATSSGRATKQMRMCLRMHPLVCLNVPVHRNPLNSTFRTTRFHSKRPEASCPAPAERLHASMARCRRR